MSKKTHIYEKAIGLLDLVPGKQYEVLDFGAGTGAFLGLLSQIVSDNSRLVGYEAMEESISVARESCPAAEFVCERFSQNLPFPDASFDLVITIDSIECIQDKKALVDEMYRILKPSGKVLAMHWDWDTQTYALQTKELSRKAALAFSDWQQPWMDHADGQMGRKLWGLFEGSGKFHGRADAYTHIETKYEKGQYGYERAVELSGLVEGGVFDKNDYEQLLRELKQSSERGEYFYSVTAFIYYGERRIYPLCEIVSATS